MSKEKIEFEIGSGNVFKDLGFPNPEEELMKARFAAIIYITLLPNALRQFSDKWKMDS